MTNARRAVQRWFFAANFQRVSAQCRVAFHVLRDGTILNPEVLVSTGNPALDQLAIKAIYDTRSIGALPDYFDPSAASVRMIVTFDFSKSG
ncbi:MAG: Gram-negative bacterial tonB protein [candidate division BRC1 bacterium ADurb.BinA364]|nr:MAG: Gram-negative bacterial tonB protein [candidate division BRC1 bacterium ADurb.BinA364]